MSIRIFNPIELSRAEAETLSSFSPKPIICANSNCDVKKLYDKRTTNFYTNGPISKIKDMNIYTHTACLPGQTWQDKLYHGVRATIEGAISGMQRHPYITAAATLTLAGMIGYTYLSAEVQKTVCFQDVADKSAAWCSTIAENADISKSVFEKYIGIREWVHSQQLTQLSYDQVSNGQKFVYETVTKYFVKTPTEVLKNLMAKYF